MADISQEIDQLRNAVYGEEVRGAFISCMQKIHEENESYNSTKSQSTVGGYHAGAGKIYQHEV